MNIVVDNWYNKNNATEKVFVTHRPYIGIRYERELSYDGKNVIQFYNLRYSIELRKFDSNTE